MSLSTDMKASIKRREMPWTCCDEKWVERVEKLEKTLAEIGSRAAGPITTKDTDRVLGEIDDLVRNALKE